MGCEEIRKILPRYFDHTASEEEIKQVEEHLCTCHNCRTALGELMDKSADAKEQESKTGQEKEGLEILSDEAVSPLTQKPAKDNLESSDSEVSKEEPKEILKEPEEPKEEPIELEETPSPNPEVKSSDGSDMEYFPGSGLESSLEKPESEPEKEPPEAIPEKEPLVDSVKKEQPKEKIEELPKAEELPQEEKPVVSEPVNENLEPEVEEATQETLPEETLEEPEPVVKSEKDPAAIMRKKVGARIEEEIDRLADKEKEVDYSLDEVPLEEGKAGLLEYIIIAVALIFLIFVIYLRMKG